MKHLYLFTLPILFSAASASAQIQLTDTEMTPVGFSFQVRGIADMSSIDTTIQGQNATWNFSSLTPTSSVLNSNSVVPSSTPYASSFPSANVAYVESPTTAYRYFHKTAAFMERVGSYSGSTLKTYSDPQVEYVFPMVYNASNNDTWMNNVSSTGGTYDLKVVGTGTLMLPNGSHQAIMTRVHTVESFLDLFVYFWYDADNGSQLLTVYGESFATTYSGSYQTSSGSTLGLSETNLVQDVSFNNPATTSLNVSIHNLAQKDVEIEIYSLDGKFISRSGLSYDGMEMASTSIDVSELQPGCYLMFLGTSATDRTLYRFIKQ